jgi:zinc protease
LLTKRILAAALAALFASAGCSPAADAPATPAAEAAPADGGVAPLGFRGRTLANGLQVFALRDTSTANVTLQVWYRVGSKDDPEGRSGFAHLFEHLMFKATRNLPNETFDRLTEDVGGGNNAFTADDVTAYHEVVPANHLERLLFAEADRMGSLVVDETVFASERAVVQEELRQRILAEPYGRLFGLYLPREVYQQHPYRRAGIGSIEELDAATLEDVRRFHATYYRPDNAVLIVAGNFDDAQLDAWVDQYFAPLANPGREVPRHAVAEPEQTAPKAADYYAPNVPLPAVVAAWDLPAWGHPDRAALEVLDGILSTGESSRMYRTLVYDRALASDASSWVDMGQQAGMLVTYAIAAEGEPLADVEAGLLEVIAGLAANPITQAELDEAKAELLAGALRGRESIEDRASTLGWSLINTGGPAAADAEVAALQAVTVADVQRVAGTWLTEARRSVIRYRDESERPEGASNEALPAPVEAPVKLADLATDYRVDVLAPEAERAALPQPGPAPDVGTPEVVERQLANGLRVFVARREGLPLVSARLVVPAGTADDPDGRTGTASMLATLLTQGSTTRGAPEVAAEIERLGAVIGADAGRDASFVYANSPANVFPQTLALMAELVRTPALSAEELERARDQARDGLSVAMSQPGPIASAVASRLVYGDAPYGEPGAGTLDGLAALTREDVAGFHAQRFSPQGASLVFSGAIGVDEAVALAEQAFGDWAAPATPATRHADPAGETVAPRVVVVDLPGSGQAAVTIAGRALAVGDADYHPLELANAVLGGGYSARLNRLIRIERGLSYGAGSSLGARRDEGLVVASTQTRNDAAAEVVALMLGEFARIGAEATPDADIAPRVATLVGEFGSAMESVDGLGGTVAGVIAEERPLASLPGYPERVRAVTPAQIQAAGQRYLAPERLSIVVVGDSAQFIDALRAAHPQLELIAVDDLDLDAAALR